MGSHVAEAKKFVSSVGPKAPADTTFTEPQEQIDAIRRERGPKVPPTNLQVVTLVANTAFDKALASAPLQSGDTVLIAPAESHPLNFVVEHAVLRHLSKRGVVMAVRRSQVPDDSLFAIAGNPGYPLLEYQLASARVTYLRLRGWLPGRVKIERQALVEGALTMRDPSSGRVLWVGDAKYGLLDMFPSGKVGMVEDVRFEDLKGEKPVRNVDKIFEPVIVIAVVAGLVALFFQNRP
jgi:hypothetical protein